MYPGRGNPMGSVPNPIGSGDPMRGQYHVHQHQYHQQPQQQSQFHQQQHHHHHQLLQGQAGHRHGQHVHSHSRHPHAHERSASRDERREGSSHHHGNLPTAFAMATGGETPYGVLQPQQHGGFVMGTDLRTTMPTSGGWYHEQPEVPQVQSVMTSLESVSQPDESTVPKDSGTKADTDRELVPYKFGLSHYQCTHFQIGILVLQRVMCLVR